MGGKYCLKRTNNIAVEMCTADIMKELLSNASPNLLEPVMNMEISTPHNSSKEIINDILAVRRGKIGEIKEEVSKFG